MLFVISTLNQSTLYLVTVLGSLLRAGLPNSLSAVTVSPWSSQCRCISANTVGNPEPAPGILTRFWRWFNDEVDEEVSLL